MFPFISFNLLDSNRRIFKKKTLTCTTKEKQPQFFFETKNSRFNYSRFIRSKPSTVLDITLTFLANVKYAVCPFISL